MKALGYEARIRAAAASAGGSGKDTSASEQFEDEFKATKDMLESLFENSADAIDVLDRDGRVLLVNQAFERIYGWKKGELVGKILPIIPKFLQDDFQNIRRGLFEDVTVSGYESVRQRKDGSLIRVSVAASPIKNSKGTIVACAAITRDITSQKQTEEQLRISDKLSIAGQIAAGLAHEIKNPLTSLKGFLQLLKSGVSDKPKYYDIMLSELDRIHFIVSEMLEIAKPRTMDFRPHNPTVLLQHVISLLQPEALMNNVRISFRGRKELPAVRCSETELKQVFINVLKNAMEAMPGGGEIVINARLKAGTGLLIRFTDQGMGIPKDRLPKLGEPFYTTKEKGTGLGLMVSGRIMEAHGGGINFKSKVDLGTVVELMLPLTS